jgi:hypothetical protein
MTSFNPSKDVPSEFYSAKTFFTLSGAAASVWIFCLVIGSICPVDSISPLLYRIIAISLSEIIAILMVWRLKKKKLENWFLAIFNGLLIFVNASGWNVMTTNNFFSDKIKTQPAKSKPANIEPDNSSILTKHNYALAGFHFFKKQIYWWQDNSVFIENKHLKEDNKALIEKIDSLDKRITNINNEAPNVNAPNINLLKDSLQNEVAKRDNIIHDLKNEILLLKNLSVNNKSAATKAVTTDTLSSDERKKLLYSIRELRQVYENKLKICESEKNELQSKLNIIKQGLDKYRSIP